MAELCSDGAGAETRRLYGPRAVNVDGVDLNTCMGAEEKEKFAFLMKNLRVYRPLEKNHPMMN